MLWFSKAKTTNINPSRSQFEYYLETIREYLYRSYPSKLEEYRDSSYYNRTVLSFIVNDRKYRITYDRGFQSLTFELLYDDKYFEVYSNANYATSPIYIHGPWQTDIEEIIHDMDISVQNGLLELQKQMKKTQEDNLNQLKMAEKELFR